MRIGDLATRAGVTPKAIRFYEQLGLLRPAARTSSGYRAYPADAVDEVLLIRRAQALGFSLDEVREILDLGRSGTAPCSRVLALARRQIADIESRIELQQRLLAQLVDAVARWQDGGAPEDCAQSFCGLIKCAGVEPRGSAADRTAEGRIDPLRPLHDLGALTKGRARRRRHGRMSRP